MLPAKPVQKTISIISPCYNEGINVISCYEAVKSLFETELKNYTREHIFADDASNDDTLALLKTIAAKDSRVKIIVNSRNYGVYRSTFNALKAATGDAIVPMLPVDLQDPPSEIPKFIREWEMGTKVVYGMRFDRDEGWIMKNIRRLYYIILSATSSINIPKYAGEFQIIDRSILEMLKQYDDYYPFIRGLIADATSNRKGIYYTWAKRQHGKTKHNFYKLYDQGINGLISFSNFPMRIMVFLGVLVSIFSFIFVVVQIIAHIFFTGSITPPGMSTAIVAIFFLFGILFLFFGLMGEYIAAIHSQVRRGPLVHESDRINFHLQPPEIDT